ncbi:hypothetical protein [Umezawaea sp. NPDC059074]|uniref:hypothetical protein n=1 Tax=Umezawaea sp. NPDC059074 TaxID=3346716 RepID=UPI0036816565
MTTPDPTTAPPSSADTPRRRRFAFVRHRTTQVIAVAVLGLAIGAGVSTLASHEDGGGGDHEHSRQVDHEDQQGEH